MLEAGPDSFLAAKPWAMDLIREVGLADQVIGSNDHLRVTYILKHGKLVPLPDGLMMMVPTKILPLVGTCLLSWGTKIRMGLELLRRPPKSPSPIARSPIFCWIITARNPSIIWPSRCWRASTAAIRAR